MKEHEDLVTRLRKDPEVIAREFNATKADLLHAAVGICGEAGEILDPIKAFVIYNRPLDVPNLIEEVGDLEFYMEQLRQVLDITRDEVLEANIEKLEIRYGVNRTYTDEQSNSRKDKEQ